MRWQTLLLLLPRRWLARSPVLSTSLTAARFRLSRRQDLVGQDNDHEREETRFPPLPQTQFKTGSAWISKIESLLDPGSDVAVLENQASGLPCFADGNIHHRARQVVGANGLVREEHPKRWINRAQQPVAEVRFLPGFDRIDVGGPEDVKTRKACRKQLFFGLSLIAVEAHPALFRLVRAAPAPA